MIPYSKKYQAAFHSIKANQIIAKPPTSITPLEKPTNLVAAPTYGSIKLNEVEYQVSAFNEYGESEASEKVKLTVSSYLDVIENIYDVYTPGILPRGIYYYGITAFNKAGETNIGRVYGVKLGGAPHPSWADNPSSVTDGNGKLPAGKYFYSLTAVIAGKETDQSTSLEVDVANDDSSVTLSFKVVEGSEKYYIYRRSVAVGNITGQSTLPKRIGELKAEKFLNHNQTVSYFDNGSTIGKEVAPSFNDTTAGIQLIWDLLEDTEVLGYRIYGRLSPVSSDLKLLAEVGPEVNTYKDQGYIQPSSITAPTVNQSGSNTGVGIDLSWNVVPNALGYRIYGREVSTDTESKIGYLTEIRDPRVNTWKDTGIAVPDIVVKPPIDNSSNGVKGKLGSVVPDGITLSIDEDGLLSVKGGIDSFLGRADINGINDKHVLVYDKVKNNWVNIDLQKLIYDLLVTHTDGNGNIVTTLDPSLQEYKNELIDLLINMQSFRDEIVNLRKVIDDQNAVIEEMKQLIGNPIGIPKEKSSKKASKSRKKSE